MRADDTGPVTQTRRRGRHAQGARDGIKHCGMVDARLEGAVSVAVTFSGSASYTSPRTPNPKPTISAPPSNTSNR